MENKLREILIDLYNDAVDDDWLNQDAKVDKYLKELETLIKQREREAVEGFATYLWDIVVRYDDEQELKEALETYLKERE